MIKTLSLLTISLALVAGASAGQTAKPKKTAKQPTTIKCAVETDNSLKIADATKNHMYADYKGNRYFFCCDGCPQQFKAHPEKFAKNAHIPTPKKK
jgi:YHS domain-containing protein